MTARRDNVRMDVHFYGSYRYASRDSLERALSDARAILVDDDAADDATWRCFVTRGTQLTVNLTAPVDRFSAAAVFDTLSRTAIEGAVEARRGVTPVDLFPWGSDDD